MFHNPWIHRVIRILLGISGFFIATMACASVDQDLDTFFNGLGYLSNTTEPRAYHDQAAGYYTGGSLFLRNRVKNYQLISIELPSFSGGCSGIDAFLGSFSVINGAQLTQMMKNILSAGGAYAFDLALTTTVPQIRSVKDFLQKYISDINNMNINSCNTAEDLVGGLWPKTQNAQQQICRDIGSHNGVFTDWAQARQDCGTGGKFDQGIGDGGKRKNEVVVNKNIVWDALQQNGLTASDSQLAEALMSLSGSIIIINQGDHPRKTPLPSLADNQDMVNALLNGGQASIYRCDEYQRCLHPNANTKITIAKSHALVSQVVSMIQRLNAAVMSDAGQLTPDIRGFLEMTPIPVLKYITNSASLGKAINPSDFSEIIAISLLNQYLSENIKIIELAMVREDSNLSLKMEKQISIVQHRIATLMASSYRKLANINVLSNKLRADEQQLTSRIISDASQGQAAE